MFKRVVFILIATSLLNSVPGNGNPSNGGNIMIDPKDDDDDFVEISPKCAAVLLVGGTSLGAAFASTLTPTALCTAGFCSTGIIAANTLSSTLQSAMPFLVAKGSVVSILQSLALGAVGARTGLPGAALGGVIGAQFVTDLYGVVDETDSDSSPLGQLYRSLGGLIGTQFVSNLCGVVDETDSDTPLGRVFSACETTAAHTIQVGGDMKDYCDSSETCSMVSEFVGEATSWVSSQLNGFTATATNQVQAVPLRLEIRQLQKEIDDHNMMIKEKCWWTMKFSDVLPSQTSRRICPSLNEAKDLLEQLSKKEEELAKVLKASE